MAKYVSIKGWLACEGDDVKLIKDIIKEYELSTNYDIIMDNSIRKLYNKGWHFQEEAINWTSYVFYGADIKSHCLSYIKDELADIIKINDEMEGIFFIDVEDGDKVIWKISDGELLEKKSDGLI